MFNLFTHYDETVLAMTLIEGHDWLDRQHAGEFGEFSLKQAIGRTRWRPIIYGRGGWNRYVVMEGGEVCFIGLQAGSKEDLQKAIDLGFRIVSEEKKISNPGSQEARNQGCTCPIMDNEYGAGWMGDPGVFVVVTTCPLHKKKEDKGGDASSG